MFNYVPFMEITHISSKSGSILNNSIEIYKILFVAYYIVCNVN